METIYHELLTRVEQGEPFVIDFKKRNLKISHKYIIKDGEYGDRNLIIDGTEDVLKTIEYLYTHYKFSLPSERSDKKRKKYFYAYSIEEIPDEKLFTCFETRELARAKLEGYILCSILNNRLQWKSSMGNWFWQSKIDKDLILLKEWIE